MDLPVDGNNNSLLEFVEMNSMDQDYMFYRRTDLVSSPTRAIPLSYRGMISHYVTDAKHRGYVRLLSVAKGSERTIRAFTLDGVHTTLHGPAWPYLAGAA